MYCPILNPRHYAFFFPPSGHEPYQLLRYNPWAAVRLVHRPVLRAGVGPASAGSAESQ